jgi:FG-GAP-like repeat/ASPIC and UnbV
MEMRRNFAPRPAPIVRRIAGTVVLLAAAAGAITGCDRASTTEVKAQALQPDSLRAGQERMLATLAEIARRSDDDNIFTGTRRLTAARTRVATLPVDAPPKKVWGALYRLAWEESKAGNERRSIEALERADSLAAASPGAISGPQAELVKFRLGVENMRLGETENCCQRPSPDSCILPIRAGGVHSRKRGSLAAVGYFDDVLDVVPPGSSLGLKSAWLLNIAHMTLGDWPEAVPAKVRLPPSALSSREDFPHFPNVARTLGVDSFNLAGGAIAEDFDGDGDLDLMTSTWDPKGAMHLFMNEGTQGFVDRTEAAGLDGELGGLNLIQADYDNDGDCDVLVLRGAWLGPAGRHPNSLLRNRGDGTFVDVTFAAGLGDRAYPTQTAAWGDYDLDGDLDLYVGAEGGEDLGARLIGEDGKDNGPEPGQLFRNEGNGTFTDVTAQAGVANLRFAKGVVWGDYDGDRYPDLYVSNLGSENRLYHNRHDGTFEDVAPQLGVTGPLNSFPAWFWDFDNDGDLDLYVAYFDGGPNSLAFVVASYLGLKANGAGAPCLYRNDGGRFTEVAAPQGIDRMSLTMGANFGDVDGDGWLDFYLGTGYPDYEALMPNVMYHNRGGTGFTDVTVAGGFGHLQKGHAIVFADFDNDGDQDVFEELGGAFHGDAFGDALYENPGFGHHWVALDLVGVRSNRSAIGARIRVDITEHGRQRAIYRTVCTGGSFGANPLRQQIGLGDAEKIDAIEVWWPVTKDRQQFHDVPLDSFLRIVEGAGELEAENIPVTPLPVPAPVP